MGIIEKNAQQCNREHPEWFHWDWIFKISDYSLLTIHWLESYPILSFFSKDPHPTDEILDGLSLEYKIKAVAFATAFKKWTIIYLLKIA
jgi:hypothetical protein